MFLFSFFFFFYSINISSLFRLAFHWCLFFYSLRHFNLIWRMLSQIVLKPVHIYSYSRIWSKRHSTIHWVRCMESWQAKGNGAHMRRRGEEKKVFVAQLWLYIYFVLLATFSNILQFWMSFFFWVHTEDLLLQLDIFLWIYRFWWVGEGGGGVRWV